MIFNQVEFFIFASVVFLFLLLVKNFKAQKLFLLVASYYFYAYWDYRFLLLLMFSTGVAYFCGLGMGVEAPPRRRKLLVVTSIVANLAVLAFFKYYNFFVKSAQIALEPLGWHLQTLEIILPLGISFFTFQCLSYTIDVYRGHVAPCYSFTDLALYKAFFPQLVAGPIVRAADFLPQLETPRAMTWARAYSGLQQFVFGLFKKVFIADHLASFVDYSFANAGALNGVTLWLAVLSYAAQIYCDFSGYSDMAIGVARAMGYDFIMNFDHPYLAHNITDFWHRWHISLSTWLRDYLYIPLGGNRKGRRRTYINLMLTMLLGGLWHGASWSFVLWGGLHGGALAAHKGWREWRKSKTTDQTSASSRIGVYAGMVFTLLIVLVGWVFFRANDFSLALVMLRRMFCWSSGVPLYPPFVGLALGLLIVRHAMVALSLDKYFILKPDRLLAPVVLFLMIGLVIVFYPKNFQPFIYFQF